MTCLLDRFLCNLIYDKLLCSCPSCVCFRRKLRKIEIYCVPKFSWKSSVALNKQVDAVFIILIYYHIWLSFNKHEIMGAFSWKSSVVQWANTEFTKQNFEFVKNRFIYVAVCCRRFFLFVTLWLTFVLQKTWCKSARKFMTAKRTISLGAPTENSLTSKGILTTPSFPLCWLWKSI